MSEIPIRNLYYMLCYAWEYFKEGQIPSFDGEPTAELVDLFAMVLIKNVREMQRRGFYQVYAERTDEGRSLRGKLDVGSTVSRMLLQQAKVACSHTELTIDHDLNRVIKATLVGLLSTDEIDPSFIGQLRDIAIKMSEVTDVALDRRLFAKIRFDRLTETYRPTVKICELVFEQLVPKDEIGRFYFREFVRDEVTMRKVFEKFVHNFYKYEQTQYPVVKVERLSWAAEGSLADIRQLPQMETDTSLIRGDETVIIDTKYVAGALHPGRHGKETIRPENLYQLASYLQNKAAERQTHVRGLLLYPSVGKDVSLKYKIWGIPVTVQTLNLDQEWQKIHADLLALLDVI